MNHVVCMLLSVGYSCQVIQLAIEGSKQVLCQLQERHYLYQLPVQKLSQKIEYVVEMDIGSQFFNTYYLIFNLVLCFLKSVFLTTAILCDYDTAVPHRRSSGGVIVT